MHDDAPSPMDAKWAMEIGRFVMAFGSIEGWTYHLLRSLPRDPIAQALIDANLQLKARVNLLIDVLSSRDGPEWVTLAGLLDQVNALAVKRNLIAHNGVTMEVLRGPDGSLNFEDVIRSRKKHDSSLIKKIPAKERLAFEELVQHRKEVEALDRALMEAIGDAMGHD